MSDEPKSFFPAPDAASEATGATVPMWIFALTLTLLFLGGVYFDHFSGWFSASVYSPYVSAEQVEAYQPKSGAGAQGKRVYESVCGICHGVDGLGKPNQAPPLAGSELVNAKGINRLARVPLAGLTGPIKVAGKDYNLSMAAMGSALSDSDLAAVLTYIRGSWGNKADEVKDADVHKIRGELGARPQPMTAETLDQLPD
jgi:mono/diheme cytochrome c family protein